MARSDRRLSLEANDRSVSFQINYITTLGITTVLMVTLVMTTGSFVDNQQERAAKHELEAIGNRIATQISQADDLAARGGNVTMTIHQPRKVVGKAYSVRIGHGPDCTSPVVGTDDCLLLEAPAPGVLVKVPLVNTTNVYIESGAPGTFTVTAVPTSPANTSQGGGAAADVGMTIGVGSSVGVTSGNGTNLNLANNQPIAKFTFDPGSPTNASNIEFTSHSTDPDGGITKYEWDFDDDGTVDATGKSVTYSYSSPGRYTANLTVTDNNGVTDSDTKVVIVGGLVYERDVNRTNPEGSTYGGLRFNVTNHHDNPVEVIEVYVHPRVASIDGLEASGAEVTFDTGYGSDTETYDSSGFTIRKDGLIVDLNEVDGDSDPERARINDGETVQIDLAEFTDGGSQVNMFKKPVTVGLRYRTQSGEYLVSKFVLWQGYNVPPDPEIATPITCTDKECEFDATGSSDPDGTITNYSWDFGDGATGTGDVLNHTYAANGTYTVTLTVTDDNGTKASTTKQVNIGGVDFDLKVNFQPAGADVPAGYEVDSGDAYGARGNGYTYGWVQTPGGSGEPAHVTADRGYVADQRYDTLLAMDDGSHNAEAWEVDVPDSGSYRVYTAMGDPASWYTEPINDVSLEGLDLDDPDGEDDYDRYFATVSTSDGRLTLTHQSSAEYPIAQFIEIESINTQPFDESSGTPERIVIEAEHYQGSKQGTGNMDTFFWQFEDSDASGDEALEVVPNEGDNAGDSTDGPRLDYKVDFSTTGTHYVWVRMKCESGNDDSVHVGLDGSPQSYGGFGVSDGCEDDWTWVNRVDGDLVTLDPSSTGVHTVNLWAREDGTMIDKIIITTDSSFSPSGEGPDETSR